MAIIFKGTASEVVSFHIAGYSISFILTTSNFCIILAISTAIGTFVQAESLDK